VLTGVRVRLWQLSADRDRIDDTLDRAGDLGHPENEQELAGAALARMRQLAN